VRLKSAEFVNALSATFEQLNVLTQTSVNINQNVVKAEQGNFLLFASFLDTFYVEDGTHPSDALFFGYFKTFDDASAVADLAAKSLIRGISDPAYIVDSDVIRFIKGEFEQVGSLDTQSFGFGKALNDLVSGIGDQVFLFAKKFPDDPVGVSEDSTIATSLGKSDPTVLEDAAALGVGKPEADAFSVADLNTVGFGKVSNDQVTGVDDIASLAAGKVLTDQAVSSDNDVIAFAKALLEHGYISEAIDTLNVGKALTDVPTASDVINTFALGKGLADTVGVTDDVDGAASILDDQEMQFQKLRTHVASVSELFERQVNFIRAFSDNASASESINMVTGKQIYDIPVASETLVKAITKSPFLDSALLGDATVVSSTKVVLDLASSTDAGSLRSQGYSDFTYFAEDFVGASTTF
jgi:hypothetical protein